MLGARRKMILAVVGCTGTGKSRLAIDLAKRFNGEVINADAMQMYKGLDIATCKVTADEMQGIPHHLMSFMEPDQQYMVTDFVRDATAKIQEIQSRGKLPVLVGGTHYYIQSLLFDNMTVNLPQKSLQDSGAETKHMDLDGMNAQELYQLLKQVDPMMAERWHERDTRKVYRSLQVFYDTGMRHSEIIQAQERDARKPRYPSLLFCLHTDPNVLNERLDRRVDTMLKDGLLEEIHAYFERNASLMGKDPMSYESGPFQTIGFKEFHEYLISESRTPEMYIDAVEAMKRATRQYAKRQLAWIRHRLTPMCNHKASPLPVILLSVDSSVPDRWSSLLESFKNGTLAIPSTQDTIDTETSTITAWKKYHCELCERTLNGNHEWHVHLKSKSHWNEVRLRKSSNWPFVLQARLRRKQQQQLSQDQF